MGRSCAIYPLLLRALAITRSNCAWAMDIRRIRLIGLACARLLTLHIVMGRCRAVAASTELTGERPQPLSVTSAPESHRTA